MKKYTKWILLVFIVVTLLILSAILPVKDWIRAFINWVQQLGPIGVVVFVVAYALATVLFLPGWIFTVGAGLVYGIVGGTLVALTGAVIGATLAFIVARYLVRKNIEEYTKKNARFKAIDEAIGKNGWKIIGLLRLSPLIPFNLSNYFYGITSVSLKAYVAVSAIGMIPGTLLYAYLGAIGKAGISGEKTQHSGAQYILLGVGLVATIAVTILVSRIAKNALKKSGATNKDVRVATRLWGAHAPRVPFWRPAENQTVCLIESSRRRGAVASTRGRVRSPDC